MAKVKAVAGLDWRFAGFIGGTVGPMGWPSPSDSDKNAYLTGQTFSTQGSGFPLTVGAFDLTQNGSGDVFVTKINPTGTGIVYSTFVGGAGAENAQGIALDPGCERDCAVYVAGETASSDMFPSGLTGPDGTFNGGPSGGASLATDAFVFKLNAAGSALVYGGYVGGSGTDTAREIAVDSVRQRLCRWRD